MKARSYSAKPANLAARASCRSGSARITAPVASSSGSRSRTRKRLLCGAKLRRIGDANAAPRPAEVVLRAPLMKRTKMLLLAGAVFYLASPALADAQTPSVHWWNNIHWPWSLRPSSPQANTAAPQATTTPQKNTAWACSEYEYANNCRAELSSTNCQCIGGDPLGSRLDQHYGPGKRSPTRSAQ